jgi:nucleoid-associated protein YgaU
MTSPQCSVPVSVLPSACAAARSTPLVPGAARAAGRGVQPGAPATGRRDPVRPGGRPARRGGAGVPRPVRGGCSPEAGPRPVPLAARAGRESYPPLRLTERGRRVVAGLSVAIGLSIAAATVVTVQLGDRDGGLQLAGASTVVVQPGDTLWSLAQEAAPEEDTRAVVDAIVELNGLEDVDLLPGAELLLP